MTPSQRRRSRNRLKDFKSERAEGSGNSGVRTLTASNSVQTQTDLPVQLDGKDNSQVTNVEPETIPIPHVINTEGARPKAASDCEPLTTPSPDQDNEEQSTRTELDACTAFLDACASAESCLPNPPVTQEEIRSALAIVKEAHALAQESLRDGNVDPVVKHDMMDKFTVALENIECMMTHRGLMPALPPSGYPPPGYPPPGYPPLYPPAADPMMCPPGWPMPGAPHPSQ